MNNYQLYKQIVIKNAQLCRSAAINNIYKNDLSKGLIIINIIYNNNLNKNLPVII